MTYWKSALVFLFAAAASAQATTLYYWDFNGSDSLTATIGSGTATVEYAGLNVFGGADQGVGTEKNLVPPYDKGESVEFYEGAGLLIDQRIQFTELDFSAADQVQISFAVRSTEFFGAGDTFKIRYRAVTGVGEDPESPIWTEINWTSEAPTDEWSIKSFTLAGLGGASSAQIQINSSAIFEAISVLEFDNVQISAVPEPSSMLLLTVSGGVAAFLILRRRVCCA